MKLFHGTNRKFLRLQDRIHYFDPAYPYKNCCAQASSYLKHACAHYTYWYMEFVLLILSSMATARIAFTLLFSSEPQFSQATLFIAMGFGVALVLLFAILYIRKREDRINIVSGYKMQATAGKVKLQRIIPMKLKDYPAPQLLETRYKDYRSSGFKDFLESNLLNQKDFQEAEFKVFVLIVKKIIPNVYQNFKICLQSCNEILSKHNLEIVFQENQTEKIPLLFDQIQAFIDFLKYELLGVSYPVDQKSKQVGLKYKQFSKLFLTSQVNLKKDLLEYMYQFQIHLRYFLPSGFESKIFSYVYNRTAEIQKLTSIQQVQTRTGGLVSLAGLSWNHSYPTDIQILSHLYSWHFDKQTCDQKNFSLYTDQATIHNSKEKYLDHLKGVYIRCLDGQYKEPYFEVCNQGNLFPTQPGNHSLFSAIVIYLYILYRQGEVFKRNLQDVSKFVLLPLLKRN